MSSDLFLPLLGACALALLSALAVILVRRPVYAAMALLVHSLSLAALFAILAAGVVAVGQVIIYSGAIVVLFLFVVTLLPSGGSELTPSGGRVVAALVAAAAVLAAFAAALIGGVPAAVPASATLGGVDQIGRALFGPLLVAFELTAPLLLVAIVGAVSIWRRHEPRTTTSRRVPVPAERRLVIHK
jgi:NADH-quinone oxidoreductase subunit J